MVSDPLGLTPPPPRWNLALAADAGPAGQALGALNHRSGIAEVIMIAAMRCILPAACFVALVLGGVGPAHPQSGKGSTIALKEASDIAIAQDLSVAIDAVSKPVSACVKDGGGPTACQCRNKAAIVRLKAVVDDALARRPAWNTHDAVLVWERNGVNYNVSIAGVLGSVKSGLQACP